MNIIRSVQTNVDCTHSLNGHYSYNGKKLKYIQKLLFKILDILHCQDSASKCSYSTIVINLETVREMVYFQANELKKRGKEPRVCYLGQIQYEKIVGEVVTNLDFIREFDLPDSFCGMRLVVLPYMDGVLVAS